MLMMNRCEWCQCARIAGGTILLAALLAACATHHGLPQRIAPLDGLPAPSVEVPDFRRLSPAMAAFLQRHVDMDSGREKRAWSLVWATTDRNVLDFDYDPGLTLPPAETFARRSGNCLSFSLMLIAMARHLGLDAWYQEVEVPPQWNSANNTLLISMHINVVVQGVRGAWVVDVSGEAGARTRHLRRLGDEEAVAQYLNNLGAEALTSGDLAVAHAYFARAIETAPKLSYLWSNLGVVYNRNGQTDEAEAANRTALTLDSGNSVAANNLFLIYEQAGDLESARTLQAQVEKHRRKNPYYLYHLSTAALEQGRVDESRLLLEQAIQINAREYRFHYGLARVLMRGGDRAAARASLDRALQLAPGDALAGEIVLEHLPALPD
jgi:Flp pilus assembly protein TadD